MPRIPPPIMSLVKIQIEHLIKDGEKDLANALSISAMLIEKSPEIIGTITKNTISGGGKFTDKTKEGIGVVISGDNKSMKERIYDAFATGSNYAKVKLMEETIAKFALTSDDLNAKSYDLVDKGFSQIKVKAPVEPPKLPNDTTDYNEYWFDPEDKIWTDIKNKTYPITDKNDVMFFKKTLKQKSSEISGLMKKIDVKNEAANLESSIKLNIETEEKIKAIKNKISDLEDKIKPLYSNIEQLDVSENIISFNREILRGVRNVDYFKLERMINQGRVQRYSETDGRLLTQIEIYRVQLELDYRKIASELSATYLIHNDLLALKAKQNLEYSQLHFNDVVKNIKYEGYADLLSTDLYKTIPTHMIEDFHISDFLAIDRGFDQQEISTFRTAYSKLINANVIGNSGGLILVGTVSKIDRHYEYTPDNYTVESEDVVKNISDMDISELSENFTLKDPSGKILYEQTLTLIKLGTNEEKYNNNIKFNNNESYGLTADEAKYLTQILHNVVMYNATSLLRDGDAAKSSISSVSEVFKFEISGGSGAGVNSYESDVFDSESLIDEVTFKYTGPIGDSKKVELYCYTLLDLFNPIDILLQIYKAITRLITKIRIFITKAYKAVSLLVRAKKTGIQVGKDSVDSVSSTFQTVASVGVGSSVSIVTI